VRPGRVADHSPLLVPRSWKSRAIPLPSLWATPGSYRDHFYVFGIDFDVCICYIRCSVVLLCLSSKPQGRFFNEATATFFQIMSKLSSITRTITGCCEASGIGSVLELPTEQRL